MSHPDVPELRMEAAARLHTEVRDIILGVNDSDQVAIRERYIGLGRQVQEGLVSDGHVPVSGSRLLHRSVEARLQNNFEGEPLFRLAATIGSTCFEQPLEWRRHQPDPEIVSIAMPYFANDAAYPAQREEVTISYDGLGREPHDLRVNQQIRQVKSTEEDLDHMAGLCATEVRSILSGYKSPSNSFRPMINLIIERGLLIETGARRYLEEHPDQWKQFGRVVARQLNPGEIDQVSLRLQSLVRHDKFKAIFTA